MSITVEKLKEILHYNSETGEFTWKVNRGAAKAGDVARCDNGLGYTIVKINRKRYRAHRLAWSYTYGTWPEDQLDHINGVRNDNRIINLREASNWENSVNGVHRRNLAKYEETWGEST